MLELLAALASRLRSRRFDIEQVGSAGGEIAVLDAFERLA